MKYVTIYHADSFAKVFFFSTDHCQEFEDEERFVPVSTIYPVSTIREQLAEVGYREIENPNSAFAPEEAKT